MLLQQSLKLTLRKWIQVILILNKKVGSLKKGYLPYSHKCASSDIGEVGLDLDLDLSFLGYCNQVSGVDREDR